MVKKVVTSKVNEMKNEMTKEITDLKVAHQKERSDLLRKIDVLDRKYNGLLTKNAENAKSVRELTKP